MDMRTVQLQITYLGVTFDVLGNYTRGTPDQTTGPPEACYEGEPSEFEVTVIALEDCDGNLLPLLDPDVVEVLETWAIEMCDKSPIPGRFDNGPEDDGEPD